MSNITCQRKFSVKATMVNKPLNLELKSTLRSPAECLQLADTRAFKMHCLLECPVELLFVESV